MASTSRILSGERELAIETMHERAHRAARGLESLGVGCGDAIAVYLRNDFPFFEAAYAANRLGAYLVPINWHFSGPEVTYIVQDSGAKALIGHADLLVPIQAHVPASCRVMMVETPPEIAAAYALPPERRRVPDGEVRWEHWLEQFAPLPPGNVPRPAA